MQIEYATVMRFQIRRFLKVGKKNQALRYQVGMKRNSKGDPNECS
jgi:hypothetical protein